VPGRPLPQKCSQQGHLTQWSATAKPFAREDNGYWSVEVPDLYVSALDGFAHSMYFPIAGDYCDRWLFEL
jgi:hypothetical protein